MTAVAARTRTSDIVARVSCVAAVAGGITVVGGWALNQPRLASLFPGAVAMKPNAAIGVIALGCSILLLSLPGARAARAGRLLSGMAIILGVLTLFEYATTVDLHIDQLLLRDGTPVRALARPGRMAPGAAAALVALGCAALYGASRRRRGHVDEALGAAVAGVALAALLGYGYRAPLLYESGTNAGMTANTASLLLLLALAVVARAGDGRLTRLITSRGPGGMTFRRLLPAAVFVPAVSGGLLLWGHRAGLFSPEFAVAVLVAVTVMVFTMMLWKASERIDGLDGDRRLLIDGLEHRVKERTIELEQINEELEQFAYVASHDLQEPLRMVASYVQLLKKRYRGRFDADADEYIDFAVDGASRMQTLILDLLSYSRVGRSTESAGPVSVSTCVEAAVSNLRTRIAETGATINHRDLPEVDVSDTELTQLFQNLIGNALKFHGVAAPVIDIDAIREDGVWQFAVRDNGIGIEPQQRHRIFVVFQRLHSREAFPGTGIGLAICKKVVEHHRGRIWVDSEPGQGSTFRFTLPIVSQPPAGVTAIQSPA